ncbi:DEAD/DEAH box helicase [Usitatibacter palustris]|uniref:DEAD-box ATP-dependent RNA helicase RhpA n=1 Tax=Usitatibacter palustris TaxID=2732487 RepID=A0A6M4HAM3_9PROT|nr:DEAD/DEAH box helicase [Usitatibacter palustris]QJR15898.1 ATP-dependent RNA helicase DeaD [Usitatibacter palustris]
MPKTPAPQNPAPQSPAPQNAGFSALGLDDKIVAALTALGYEEPTPIQQETIPTLIKGKDLLGQAATGTGKTAAFALPILQRLINEGRGEGPLAVVLVPTRELAMQVAEAMHRYGKALGARVLPVYGGQPIGRQLHAMRAGVDVVVATPGRALDHLRRGSLQMAGVKIVVLDEADEMLDMGFAEDIEAVLKESPATRQTVLFSATMPPRIESIAKRNQRDPVRIKIAKAPAKVGEAPKVRQQAYLLARAGKAHALERILDLESPTAAIIFCRTRIEVDELSEALNARGYKAEALHGGMTQEQRDKVMRRVRAGDSELLIATDVAARGLDIDRLTHVINYDLPAAPEAYVHRIGRVGRAGREGVAITLVEPREHYALQNIERLTKHKIEIARVPTVADLQARKLELTIATLREGLVADDNEHFRVVIDALSDDYDPIQIAMAAVKLYHNEVMGDAEEEDVPPAPAPVERPSYPSRTSSGTRSAPRTPHPKDSGDMARIFIGAGREAGMRPQDLVGAIANEAGVAGGLIGAIQITDRFSLVEVPEAVAAQVIKALSKATLRGKKVPVRRDKGNYQA